MAQPPKSPPSSDIEGVHRDRGRGGQPAADTKDEDKAREQSKGRPARSLR